MQVTIIGAGNVGTVLGRELQHHGHRVAEVWSRNAAHAQQLADELHSLAVKEIRQLSPASELYLITVTDDALPSVTAQLSVKDKLAVHTAGSVSKNILASCSTQYGVLWPVKMIRKTMPGLGTVTTVVDGNSSSTIKILQELAASFSTTVSVADDSSRLKLHMLASVTSNFTNHLYHLAAMYCEREGIDFSVLYPIIEDTAERLRSAHPAATQAGPAFRGDELTISGHLRLLQEYPQLEHLYKEISRSISQLSTRGPVSE